MRLFGSEHPRHPGRHFGTNLEYMEITMQKLKSFLKNVDGATAIEYGLIAAGIAVVIIVVVFALGEELVETFETVNGQLNTANDNAG